MECIYEKIMGQCVVTQPDQSADVNVYQAGLDQLITEIDKTSGLVKANQLAQAKEEGKNLLMIRNQNHKQFK